MTARQPLVRSGAFLLLGLFAILAPRVVSAVPVYFENNGHYYDFIQAPEISWADAYLEASQLVHESMTGYLATLTSAAENEAVYEAFGPYFSTAWIGGYLEPSGAAEENWRWVTDEEWSFTNWADGEPNYAGDPDEECYLQILGSNRSDPGCWNDDPHFTRQDLNAGFIVEYSGTADPVPEPATLVLLGIGIGGLAFTRRRSRG